MNEEPIEAVIARLREALEINEHGNGIVGFNTFAEVNGSDLSRLLDYVEKVRAENVRLRAYERAWHKGAGGPP